jgi:hypothetical protein
MNKGRKFLALRRLEQRVISGENILTICSVRSCGKLKIPLDGKDGPAIWISRDDDSHLYDGAIIYFEHLRKMHIGGLSHGLCPKDLKKYYGQIKNYFIG